MKKVLAIAALTIFLLCAGCAQPATQSAEATATQTANPELFNDDHDVRNVDWGMTKEEVRAVETAEFSLESRNMVQYFVVFPYSTETDGTLTYFFGENGGCNTAMFMSEGDFMTDGGYLTAFNDAKAALESTCGEPYSESALFAMWIVGDTGICLDTDLDEDVTTLLIAPRDELDA